MNEHFLTQAASQAVVVEILRTQSRSTQDIDRLIVQIVSHQVKRPTAKAQSIQHNCLCPLTNTHLLFAGPYLLVDFFDQPVLLADPSHNPQVINPLCFIARFGVHPPRLPDILKIRYSKVRNVGSTNIFPKNHRERSAWRDFTAAHPSKARHRAGHRCSRRP